MNILSLENFLREVDKTREYLKHIQLVNTMIICSSMKNDSKQIQESLGSLQLHHQSFRTDRKIFEYTASIISLYGLLEKYVEMWIKEYLESLPSLVSNYGQIDEKIKDNHFELSLKLINTMISRESSKYQHLTKERVLEKLYQCSSNARNYNLNAEAFVLFSGNLKHKQIVNLFNYICIDLNKLLNSNIILNQYIQEKYQALNISNLETDNLYNIINDLVDRRNLIAHGSEIIDILDISELNNYIDFLEKYCQAIFEALEGEFVKKESTCNFQKIENVIRIFNNKILAFEIESYTLKVGDALIVETIAGNFHKIPILTIQLNDVDHEELKIGAKTKIAISVDHKIKENQTFYLPKKMFDF